MDTQFNRTELLIGREALYKLHNSRIAIVGLGGVGSFAAESLARAGIGHFLLIDFDVVGVTNLNRQILALHSTIGRPKTEVLRERILDINPQAEIVIHTGFCAQENRSELLHDLDFIVDAIDSLGPKVGLLEDAYKQGMKIISVLGAGNRLDPSMVHITDIAKTFRCPLAKRIRKFLRRRGIDSGIPVVFSSEEAIKDFAEDTEPLDESISTRGRNRGTIGSISYMPAIMGMTAASYVLRNLVYGFSVPSGKTNE